jgi:SAM-dependent methyltransferase
VSAQTIVDKADCRTLPAMPRLSRFGAVFKTIERSKGKTAQRNRRDRMRGLRVTLRAWARSVGYVCTVSLCTATTYNCAVFWLERYCLASWRTELLSSLEGDVLELGAGTGVNLDYYQDQVANLTLVEPDRFMRQKLARRLKTRNPRQQVRLLEASAEALNIDDASIDAVVATLVLCSVKDVLQVLAEARRVLRPNGKLVLIEHVAAAPGTSRRFLQNCLEPAWTRLSGGCHLLRDPRPALESVGFKPARVMERELRGVPGFIKSAILGTWTT